MKKLLFLGLLLIQSFWVLSQSTDATLTTQANVIRNETATGGNTKTRIANMFQALIDSKSSIIEGITASGTNTYTATANATIISYVTGQKFLVLFTNANTTAATLNINALGAKAIKKNSSTALIANDIVAGQIYWVAYDGTNFQLVGSVGGSGGGGTWGSILGTLSNQTDLQTSLNAKDNIASGVTAAGTNTYTATASPAPASYVSGQKFLIQFTNANTGAATLNLNSLGPVAIKKNSGTALASGDIHANQEFLLAYDGTNFQIVGSITAAGGGGDLLSTNNLSDVVSPSTSRTNLGATTVGSNLFTATNPSAITFPKVAADNTVSFRTPAQVLSDIGAQASGSYAVTTNNLSDLSNAGTARTNLGLAIGTNVQAFNTDLLGIAGLTPTNDDIIQRKAGAWANRTVAQYKTDLALNNVENTALSTWAGSTNLTTLGTISTGTWHGGIVGSTWGGTGINNGSSTLTLGGNLVTSGASTITLTSTGTTGVTLPTSGTLATLAGGETFTNKTLTSPQINTPLLDGSSTIGDVWTATNTAGAGHWAASAGGGSGWTLNGTSTLTGSSTITSNAANQHLYTGTWTASANSQYHELKNPTITGRGTTSDVYYTSAVRPSWIAGANTQTFVDLDVNATINANSKTGLSHYSLQIPSNTTDITTNWTTQYGLKIGRHWFTDINIASPHVQWLLLHLTDDFRIDDSSGGNLWTLDQSGGGMYIGGSNGLKMLRVTNALSASKTGETGYFEIAGNSSKYNWYFKNTNSQTSAAAGTHAVFKIDWNSIAPASGSADYNGVEMVGTVNNAGSGVFRAMDINFTNTAGTNKGIVLRPAVPSGFGVATPSALLDVAAGTATMAPLHLTSGTNLTSAADGNFEYDGTTLNFTVGTTRRALNSGIYTLSCQWGNDSPADAAVKYFDAQPVAPGTTESEKRIFITKAGTITAAQITVFANTVVGSNENWTIAVCLNNTTCTNIATVGAATAVRNFSNTALSIAVVPGDFINFKETCPTWATNPTAVTAGGHIDITY